MRILSVFGTRPEAVKMAPVVLKLAANPVIESRVCVTAQHREMLDQVLDLFHIVPDIDLNIMRPDQSLAELTSNIFKELDPVLRAAKPDWILVQGDTTTVMSTALLAYYHRIHIGHVEAGLRTHNKWHPFPEEINRRVAGVVADLHFAPTAWARDNLLRENVPDAQIRVTGNPVIDALQIVSKMPVSDALRKLLDQLHLPVDQSPLRTPRLVLVTAHRRENFGQPLENICMAIRILAEHYSGEVYFIYPVHLNPNVQTTARRILGNVPNVALLDPLDYLPWVQLIQRASLILTDSGGLQEEAPGLGVPVLVMRKVTERPEGVEAGTVRLVGTDLEKIIAETRSLLDDPQAHARMARAVNPYGDGRAADRIVQALLGYEDTDL
ncbi:MAG: UDP-N-acetylglucosamine 2-epimerase (non-hydrolyzing) [Anaerolineae bacterium UTCFX2]|nr:UDP-N-acetylglucosamine 2-epimerase (non-hydrolyzing) [Anaerolineae bacterium]MCZ7554160.1 UDP-N-acetylglucosamine 2-epimerase (non-hydrolyzing) [Anaerolineales bacterium]OQY89251.1 MAG: UDP-N-acetylglucosamine 2-epimerase (non-hydrolyzing) [Anaerolineae bacterium UTCFX2]